MKELIWGVLLAAVPLVAWGAGGAVHLDSADIDLTDEKSLQRGAKYYFNYCAGCHSLQYMRYNRMARDLGLTEQQVKTSPSPWTGRSPRDGSESHPRI